MCRRGLPRKQMIAIARELHWLENSAVDAGLRFGAALGYALGQVRAFLAAIAQQERLALVRAAIAARLGRASQRDWERWISRLSRDEG